MATVTIKRRDLRKSSSALRSRVASPFSSRSRRYLDEAVERRLRAERLLHRFDSIAAMTPVGVEQTDSVELIRQDRDR